VGLLEDVDEVALFEVFDPLAVCLFDIVVREGLDK
jgi:hypothetical protein